jgi:hypothetical protein
VRACSAVTTIIIADNQDGPMSMEPHAGRSRTGSAFNGGLIRFPKNESEKPPAPKMQFSICAVLLGVDELYQWVVFRGTMIEFVGM